MTDPRPVEGPAAPPAASSAAIRLYRGYERTWELEMLISGAVVFALFQLPGAIDRLYARTEPNLDGSLETIVFGLHYVGTLILYALIFAFTTHLVARAFWTGLIGLQAVFPHGIRWENTKYGPISREIRARHQPSTERLLDRTDRFCSSIFSFSFALVVLLLVNLVYMGLLALVTAGVSRLFFDGERVFTIFSILIAVYMVLPLVSWIDQRFAAGWRPDAWTTRATRAVLKALYLMMLMPVYMPVLDTLASNIGRRTFAVLMNAVMMVLVTLFIVREFSRIGAIEYDSFAFVPANSDARSVEYTHYLDQRPRGELFPREPAIQSELVRGPFLRLFVPYNPQRHNRVIRERCPGVPPFHEVGIRAFDLTSTPPAARHVDAVLRCLAGLQPVRLNGRELRDLRFHFYTEPASGQRGIVAYVPTAALPAGENLLEVDPVPRPTRGVPIKVNRPQQPHYIPFWKE